MDNLRHLLAAPLLAALITGVAVWLLYPARPSLWASVDLPRSQSGPQGSASWILTPDPLQRLPREPMAVAVLSDGDLLVADVGLQQIYRFGPDRRQRATYHARGAFRYPIGLAVAGDDRVWVADLWQRSLFRLDLKTDTVELVPREPSGYEGPGGLAYRNGLLYVTDLVRHQAMVLTPAGGLVQVIGQGRGAGSGQFAFPNGIWPSASGEIFVADSNNNRIQVFDATGRFSRTLQPHRLLLPRGIVQDTGGRLHVADTLANDIAVLDTAGRILIRYGAEDGVSAPNGLAVRDERIYAADRGSGRVLAWDWGDGR